MNPEENSVQHDVSVALLDVVENFTPFLDAAEGFKAKMESRGWSPSAAEMAASTMLNGLILSAMTGVVQAQTKNE